MTRIKKTKITDSSPGTLIKTGKEGEGERSPTRSPTFPRVDSHDNNNLGSEMNSRMVQGPWTRFSKSK